MAGDIREQFRAKFGREPQVVSLAPGRVNLIGEHTDYNDGYVFPAAIDRGMHLAAEIADGPSELFSDQTGAGESFDTTRVEPGQLEHWAKYPAGMAWALRREAKKALPNLRAIVDSNIPIGSGVSSSAAIELAFGVAWNKLASLGFDNRELAKLGQVCENQFVGVNSGIMDQMASAMGKAGHAMFLDTRHLTIEYAPIPDGISIVLLDTLKPRELVTSAYNERRAECEVACAVLGIQKLRDIKPEELHARRGEIGDRVYRRAKHVVTENERCLQFREALAAGDLTKVGRLMRASHESLRDDYEVTGPELDAMAESAWLAPGCVGARMTGAGFGGACVALVDSGQTDAFIAATLAGYDRVTQFKGAAMVCLAAEGARVL